MLKAEADKAKAADKEKDAAAKAAAKAELAAKKAEADKAKAAEKEKQAAAKAAGRGLSRACFGVLRHSAHVECTYSWKLGFSHIT
ncbi:hypothetical protein CYMTET_43740 [Cymbomonas tetramitiformis]|uniref:Uncharacterized protein n=1 Tax=Cymbomonas tetramitiformis TaxID=36881 RepID=A0AAE0C2P2_9CHLO|nr:hypothetical protein CYMTET_43740 [Cymbomonas tetramitiformis]